MRLHGHRLRLGAWLTTTSLCLTSIVPAWAQPASPQGAEQAGFEQAGEQGADAPALAGRLASLNGSVSFHAAGETQWNAATLNYPVTTGEAFWTEPQASATLEIADNRLVMDDSTELDITALDQTRLQATEAQGAVFLQFNSLPSGQGVSFDTPRGTVQISAPGRYEIVAGDTNDATLVTVVEGAARVTGAGLSLDLGPQQTATIGGTDTLQGSVGAMQQDAFLQAQLQAQSRRVASPLPAQTRFMTGAADLQQYGNFSQSAEYGQVWYPNDVARDWAPYRDGHWSYVQPWGWTWVDNARWGFAPFHYGRWLQVNDRWGWIPGEQGEDVEGSPYPVYSPALVSFLDVGGAALAGAAIGFAAGELAGGYGPAWIPLGPREAYYPWYRCRPAIFVGLNRRYGVPREILSRGPTYVTNVNITNNVFVNRRFATVSPRDAFVRGEQMRGFARPLPERALANARPVVGRLAVRPTAFTPNLPPAAARRFNVALPARPVGAVAAGPRILPASIGRPGHIAPELRRAVPPGNVRALPAGQVGGRPDMGRLDAGRPGGPREPGGVPNAGARQDRLGTAGALARPDAPGPAFGGRSAGNLPALRAPGARPEAVPTAGILPPQRNAAEQDRGRVVPRTNAGFRPGAVSGSRGGEVRPEGGTAVPGQARQAPDLRSLGPVSRSEPARTLTRADAPRPEARAPRPETPRPGRVEPARSAPASRTEAPRPQARPETPRPAAIPRVEAPRAPRLEAPRTAPRTEAPRSMPRTEMPRPATRVEAPRPAPAPRPMPAPRPQVAPAPHPVGPGPERHPPH